MGLFSFIKDAGAKTLGFGKETEESSVEKAEKLAASVNFLGFSVENLSVVVEGDKAILSGEAADLETKEKVVLVVGNTEGIASVEDNLTVAGVESVESVEEVDLTQYHTVVSGDTLGKISKTFYGDAMKYPLIFEANKPMLKDVNKIYPGQMLRIPVLVE